MAVDDLVEVQGLESLAANRREQVEFRCSIDEFTKRFGKGFERVAAHMRIHRILVCVQLIEPHHVGIEGIVMKDVSQCFGLTLRCCQTWLYRFGKCVALTRFDS